jgi:hypothetical protein
MYLPPRTDAKSISYDYDFHDMQRERTLNSHLVFVEMLNKLTETQSTQLTSTSSILRFISRSSHAVAFNQTATYISSV